MNCIKNNYEAILKNVENSVQKSNRSIEDITIVAVTKNVSIEKMTMAKELGITNFGENKVQELLKKFEIFGNNVTWHFIGHLQKNKVKYIVDKVDLIHSVDSIALCNEINKRAKAIDKVQKVLLQVNIGKDDAKFGIDEKEIREFISDVEKMNNVEICGFMTIIPFTENSDIRRSFFKELYEKGIDNSKFLVHNVNKLTFSMGMTSDYQEAVEENSNMIRIGTGLFTD